MEAVHRGDPGPGERGGSRSGGAHCSGYDPGVGSMETACPLHAGQLEQEKSSEVHLSTNFKFRSTACHDFESTWGRRRVIRLSRLKHSPLTHIGCNTRRELFTSSLPGTKS